MKRELVVCGALTTLCLVAVPTAAQAAPTTCNAKPVTILADLGTTIGTEGNDTYERPKPSRLGHNQRRQG